MHIMMATVLICFIISTLYIVCLKAQFWDHLSSHKERSIKLYLDRELIIKMISNLADRSGIHNIIHDATMYFTLEDIIILDSEFDFKSSKHNDIILYIQNNMHKIAEHLSKNKFLKPLVENKQIDNQGSAKHLLIQYLGDKENHCIIYVADTKHELSKNDIEVLTNAITPILKIAYINQH